MKVTFLKVISLVSVALFVSCNGLSELMNRNYYSDIPEIESFLLTPDDFPIDMPLEERARVVDEYADIALDSLSSPYLFDTLSEDSYYPDTLNALSSLFLAEINYIEPDVSLGTNVRNRYQKLNLARAKIEVYPRDNGELGNIEAGLVGYKSGIITGVFTESKLRTDIFDLPTDEAVSDDRVNELEELFTALSKAGDSLIKLGESILDLDFPASPYLSLDEGPFVLFVLVSSNIIEKSLVNFSDNRSQVIDQIVTDLSTGDFESSVIYPSEMTESTVSHRYLGEEGALVFSATGYELPESLLLEGGE